MKIKIFVIYHNKVNKEFYKPEAYKIFTFINVTNNPIAIDEKFTNIKLDSLDNYMPLGKWYAESEVIYNVYKNRYLYEGYDYIGFIHHDMNANVLTNESINKILNDNNAELLIFQPYNFREVYKQKILMDEKQPNKLRGNGINCYETILDDYNHYENTVYSTQDYYNETICLCSAFLVNKDIFCKMMIFVSGIIESGKLEKYDTLHKYRIQGGLLERYYGVWFMLNKIPFVNLTLPHIFEQTNKQLTFLERINIKTRQNLKYVLKL